MTLQLFGHPFSSYTMKALIALYENETPFDFRILDPDRPENIAELARRWPMRRFPLLVDGGTTVFETTAIIEHLAAFHAGPVALIPADAKAAVPVRMLDRVFDNHVMNPVQTIVFNACRPEDARDPYGASQARVALDTIYAWLDQALAGRRWAAGDAFTLADAAAAPALFYADWVQPISEDFTVLKAYRARLLARPSFARCVDDARPYRPFFPLGAPDQD
ncbi:MAG TPA: glutathione S-transferase family protein [Acidisoma sp.]|jgi:glutathione S-transferase|uniref:glutathione S-transferase family protein n=1 Tax=Acidisoma sp. TaxID=1872115 RepID=UPI002C83974D|nr:glutathione S-transferase family protein [Acidisoma sp.]HTI01008.1 glutathione S-transferase family protein [Acidisoma sp.]